MLLLLLFISLLVSLCLFSPPFPPSFWFSFSLSPSGQLECRVSNSEVDHKRVAVQATWLNISARQNRIGLRNVKYTWPNFETSLYFLVNSLWSWWRIDDIHWPRLSFRPIISGQPRRNSILSIDQPIRYSNLVYVLLCRFTAFRVDISDALAYIGALSLIRIGSSGPAGSVTRLTMFPFRFSVSWMCAIPRMWCPTLNAWHLANSSVGV